MEAAIAGGAGAARGGWARSLRRRCGAAGPAGRARRPGGAEKAQRRTPTAVAGTERTGKAEEPREPALVMRVVIRRDAPLGGARAVLVQRNAARRGSRASDGAGDPAADWSGELRLWFPGGRRPRRAGARGSRRGGGGRVRFEGGGGGAPERGGARNGGRTADGASAAEGGPGAARSGLVASRHVRVAPARWMTCPTAWASSRLLTARLREVSVTLEGAQA